jgi:hypothetical protein
MRLTYAFLGAICALSIASIAPCSVPDAELVLEVAGPPASDYASDAAPPRFTLLKNGQVYIGGTSQIAEVRLTGKERSRIRKQIDRVRKMRNLRGEVTLGPGETRYFLRLRKGETIVARGELAAASSALKPLVQLLEGLLGFDHPSLRIYRPTEYLLAVRAGKLRGGCRSWTFAIPLVDVLPNPRVVPAVMAAGWPTGAAPASVCNRDKTYIVTLRPLLPGEKP